MIDRAVTTAAILAATLAAPALAQDRSAGLMDLLGRVPAAALDQGPGQWSDLRFADVAAAGRALGTPPEGLDVPGAEGLGPFARLETIPGDLAMPLFFGLEGAWDGPLGFAPTDIAAALGYGAPPRTVTVLRLAPEAALRVAPALLAQGYEEATRDGVAALARGADDYGIDFDSRNPALPFGGGMGQSSRVALDGPVLTQAPGWPELLAHMSPVGPKGHPDLPTLAEALDLPGWGESGLVQANLLPHQLDLGAPGSGGIPPWRLGLLADLGSGEEAIALALFSYDRAEDAADAARHIAQAWNGPLPGAPMDLVGEMLGQPATSDLADRLAAPPDRPSMAEQIGLSVETGVAGQGPFVAWAALRGAPVAQGPRVLNPGFSRLWSMMIDRQLGLFGLP